MIGTPVTTRAARILATQALLLLMGAAVAPDAQGADLRVRLQPTRLANGTVFAVEVAATQTIDSIKGQWLDHEVLFSPAGARRWVAIAGISLATKKGSYPLRLVATVKGKESIHFERAVFVRRLPRKTVVLTVEGKYTAPDPETLKRIEAEKELKAQAFHETIPEALWSGAFVTPLDSTITETFGVRRVFNGALRSEHKGVDFRAAPGTELKAANRGKVLLARELFYEGNCVVLDHGQGLLTLYMHLSHVAVHEGDIVESGQVLGETGATGRVTGPHLHMSALWQGVAVDPLSLTQLTLPDVKRE